MPVPTAPPPGGRRAAKTATAAATATNPPAAPSVPPPSGPAVNDVLPFLDFVEHHPLGSSVNGVVESYSSHGAYVTVGDVRGYIPLRLMGNPPPRSAREVMKVGDAVTLVVTNFAPARRSVDLAMPDTPLEAELVPEPELDVLAEAVTARKKSAEPGAKKSAAGRKAAAKKAPARKAAPAGQPGAKKAAASKKAAAAQRTTAEKKPAAKKAPAKRAPAKKAAAESQGARKQAPAKKAATKRTSTRRTAAKKAVSTSPEDSDAQVRHVERELAEGPSGPGGAMAD